MGGGAGMLADRACSEGVSTGDLACPEIAGAREQACWLTLGTGGFPEKWNGPGTGARDLEGVERGPSTVISAMKSLGALEWYDPEVEVLRTYC